MQKMLLLSRTILVRAESENLASASSWLLPVEVERRIESVWATIDFKSEPVVRLKFRFPYLQIQAFSVNKTHFNAKILIF